MRNRILLAVVLVSAVAFSIFLFMRARSGVPSSSQAGTEEQVVEGELPPELSAADYQKAERWFQQRYAATPTKADVLMLAGDLAMADNKADTAIACYRAIGTDHPRHGLAARLQEGTLLVRENRAREAESALRDYVDAARVARELKVEDVVTAFKWLNYILSVEIRLEERKPFLAELHQIGLADPLDSKQYCFPNLLLLNSPTGRTRIQQFLDLDPDNLQLRLAQARYKTFEGQFDESIRLLEQLSAKYPADIQVAAAQAEVFFESNNDVRFQEVLKGVAQYQDSEPWVLTRMRGEAAAAEKLHEEAIRYFRAVLVKDPANAPCQMGLARAYSAIGDVKRHAEALERSAVLAEIRVNLSSVQSDASDAARELSQKCKAIGFEVAAAAFQKHAEAIAQSDEAKNADAQ